MNGDSLEDMSTNMEQSYEGDFNEYLIMTCHSLSVWHCFTFVSVMFSKFSSGKDNRFAGDGKVNWTAWQRNEWNVE